MSSTDLRRSSGARAARNGADSAVRPIRYGFLLVPNFTFIGFASAIEPLRMANLAARKRLYEMPTITFDGTPVAASNGVRITPDYAGSDAPALDALFICGPNPIPLSADRALLNWLRKLAFKQVPLGGICTGSHFLARAGLLTGYRCTIHWEDMESLLDKFPGITVSPNLFEIDRDRYTCSGGIAPMDMMFQLIGARQPQGGKLVAAISELLICERIRGTRDRQRIPLRQLLGTAQPKLAEVVSLMETNLEEPLELEELAGHAGLSLRQLERLFHDHLHRTPTQYYMELRLTRARQLLLHGEASVTDIALSCGFASCAHFTRRYGQFFGVPPGEERRRQGSGGAAQPGPGRRSAR